MDEQEAAMSSRPFMLTEDVVEMLMRLVMERVIDRTVACRFVTPWVVGDLPAERVAETGAQTIHGLDVIRLGDGREAHPSTPDDGQPFIVDHDELVRRCDRWLSVAGRTSGGER
ncbi:hypothetical protein [Oerskovia flava]|uniref:hypothetical protein n=1 Tax=Oerskovia flava TaxID=2986422 RepID=UPI00223EBF32|nr:hypothetical protein [Oerskovia sp. JB1-3-2]